MSSSSSSITFPSPAQVVLDTTAMDDDGDHKGEEATEGEASSTTDHKDDELQHRFILPTPLKVKAISFSDDSERKSIDEEDYPSMLLDASSDDESVQELLERANANKSSSQTKLLLASSTPSSASSVVIPEVDEDINDVNKGEDLIVNNQNDDMQLTNPRRNLWPNIDKEVQLPPPIVDPNDSDGKSQVSHTFVGDVLDNVHNDCATVPTDRVGQDDTSNRTPAEASSTTNDDVAMVVGDDDDEKIALAERLARDAQRALTWLETHKVDTKGLSASSGGEEDDDEVINNCLDSLQQLEMQQDDEYVNVAEQNARVLQQVLARLQQQPQLPSEGDEGNQQDMIIGSDEDDDDDEREVGQYFTVLDALNPPSVANKPTPVEQIPPEPEQFKSRDIVKEQPTEQHQQQLMNVEDPTTSVTEGDELDSEHPTASTLQKLPIENPTKRRRIWFCIGLMAVLAVVVITVGVVIGVTSMNNNNGPAAAPGVKSVSKVAPTTPAPTTSAPIASMSPSSAGTGIRINAGSSVGFTDSKGRYWQPDTGYTKGFAYQVPSSQRQQLVANTQDQELYLTQRYGTQFQYSFPLFSYNVYRVDLHFAEVYDGAFAVGRRVMDVEIERVPLLRKFDIYRTVGAFNATTQTFFIPVASGAINIVFTGTTSNATIAALEISLSDLPFPTEKLTAAPTQAP